MEPTIVTRKELYKQVWETPGSLLAGKYGVSDVALAKACRRHNIPRPPRGYWAKKQSGKRVFSSPLPDPKRNTKICIGKFAGERCRMKQIHEKAVALKPILVRERLSGLHPLVKKTKDYLEKCDQAERWNPPRGDHLAISTSPKGRRRALLIMDALIRALEERGGKVVLISNCYDSCITYAVINNIKVKFHLEEKTSCNYGVTSTKMILVMPYPQGARQTWRDGKRQSLEELLPDFLAALESESILIGEKVEEEKEKQARVEKERAVRKKVVEKYQQEKAEVEDLCSNAEAWDRAEIIRRYIAAVQAKAGKTGPVAPESDISKWLRWASSQADRIDPLTTSPKSVLDSPPPSDWFKDDCGLYAYTRWLDHLFDAKDEE